VKVVLTDIVERQEEERREIGGCTDRYCRETRRREKLGVVLTL
jgi:hypothetical protein